MRTACVSYLGGAGAFGDACQATLLYSSRTPGDVLCLDQLRAVQERSEGRIKVCHTLTDFETDGEEKEASSDYWLPGRHYHFTSQWNPYGNAHCASSEYA